MLKKKGGKTLANDGTCNENKLSGQVNGRRLSILRSYFCSSLSFSYEVSSLAY